MNSNENLKPAFPELSNDDQWNAFVVENRPAIWKRPMAYTLDFPLVLLTAAIVSALTNLSEWDAMLGGVLCFIIASFIYSTIFEFTPLKTTPGKWMMGLTVFSSKGNKLSPKTIFLRSFLRLFNYCFGGIPYLLSIFSKSNQAYFDELTRTATLPKRTVFPDNSCYQDDINSKKRKLIISGMSLIIIIFTCAFFYTSFSVLAFRNHIGSAIDQLSDAQRYIESFSMKNGRYPYKNEFESESPINISHNLIDSTEYMGKGGLIKITFKKDSILHRYMLTMVPVVGIDKKDRDKFNWYCISTTGYPASFFPKQCPQLTMSIMKLIE